jgi:hypothetical protein
MQFESDEDPRRSSVNDRKERRWNIPIPVRVRGKRSDGTEFDIASITADASPSGMRFILPASLPHGSQVHVIAPEEQFESPALVTTVSSLDSEHHLVRVRFTGEKQFERAAAAKKYAYDYHAQSWIGYLLEGIYYSSKHEPLGKLVGPRIVSLETGKDLFILRWDKLYSLHGNLIAHMV